MELFLMQPNYPDDPGKIEFGEIPNEVFLSIGKIIQNFATIDFLLTTAISKLSNTSAGKIYILLGRMPISQKVIKTKELLTYNGDTDHKIKTSIFTDEFSSCLRFRNIFAHGYFLGVIQKVKDTQYAFKIDLSEVNKGEVASAVASMNAATINKVLEQSSQLTTLLIEKLELQQSLDKALRRPLSAHKNAKARKKKSPKR